MFTRHLLRTGPTIRQALRLSAHQKVLHRGLCRLPKQSSGLQTAPTLNLTPHQASFTLRRFFSMCQPPKPTKMRTPSSTLPPHALLRVQTPASSPVLTQTRRTIFDWILFHMKHNASRGYTRSYRQRYRHAGIRFRRGHQWAVFSNPDQERRENLIVNTLTVVLLVFTSCLILECNNLHDKHRYTPLSTFRAWIFGIVYRSDLKELRYDLKDSPELLPAGNHHQNKITSRRYPVTSCLTSPVFEVPVVPGTAGVFDPVYMALLRDDMNVEAGGHGEQQQQGFLMLEHADFLNAIMERSEQITAHHLAFSATVLYDSYGLLKRLNNNIIGQLEVLTFVQKIQAFRHWLFLTRIRDFLGHELIRQHTRLVSGRSATGQMAREACVEGNRVGANNNSSTTTSLEANHTNDDAIDKASLEQQPSQVTTSLLRALHTIPLLNRVLPLPSQLIEAGGLWGFLTQSDHVISRALRMILPQQSKDDNRINRGEVGDQQQQHHYHPFGTYQQSMLIEQMIRARALALKCQELYRVCYHWGLFQNNYNDEQFRAMFGPGADGKQTTSLAATTGHKFGTTHNNQQQRHRNQHSDSDNMHLPPPIEYPNDDPMPWGSLMEFREGYRAAISKLREGEIARYRAVTEAATGYYLANNNLRLPDSGMEWAIKSEGGDVATMMGDRDQMGLEQQPAAAGLAKLPLLASNPNAVSLIKASLHQFPKLIQQSKLKPQERLQLSTAAAHGLTPETRGLFLYRYDPNSPLELPLHHTKKTLNWLKNREVIDVRLVRQYLMCRSNYKGQDELGQQCQLDDSKLPTAMFGGERAAHVLLGLDYFVPTFHFHVDANAKVL